LVVTRKNGSHNKATFDRSASASITCILDQEVHGNSLLVLVSPREKLRFQNGPPMYTASFACPTILRSRNAAAERTDKLIEVSRPKYHLGTRSRATFPRWQMAADNTADDSDAAAVDEISVRFINTPGGKDVIVSAKPGTNLLAVGDSVGVRIPRGCRSGLCGACTSDVVDNDSSGGVQIVRACQTLVALPYGYTELIVDVHRIGKTSNRDNSEPMARFDNLDTDYVAGAAPRRKGANRRANCAACSATGDVTCYNCDGHGVMQQDMSQDCQLCVGTGMLRCAKCQGTGSVMI
jgi:2Fe-2S iron-sulfur cluster binding domain